MSLVAFQAQKEIVAQLKTIPNGPGKFIEVYEGATTDEEMHEIIAAQGLVPFVVVNFTGFSESPRRMQHIVGAASNSNEMQTIVQTVADSDANARRLWASCWEKLVGFEPTNCGELGPALFHASGRVSFLGSPTRFSTSQSFVNLVNSDKVC